MGTFNPDADVDKSADFFYGRIGSYFWLTLWNIFVHKDKKQSDRRKYHNGPTPYFTNPDLDSIKNLCSKIKITFADLMKSVNVEHLSGYRDADLAKLARNGQATWYTDNIISYLQKTPSINTVYLTLQSTDVWANEWCLTKTADYGRKVKFIPIYTPTGQALAGTPRYEILLCHWLFNNHPLYGRLDHEWLKANGVQIEHFRNLCQTGQIIS